MNETIEKIAYRDAKRQDSKPVLFEKRNPLIPVGETFVFDKFAKEDIAPDGAQSEGDRIEDQPEDDIFCRYFGPVFLYVELTQFAKRYRTYGGGRSPSLMFGLLLSITYA